MPSIQQSSTVKRNSKNASAAWQSMTPRQRTARQPQGNTRKKPGTTGEGDYYRIIVRQKNQFTMFRYHDVGKKSHIQRLSGKRPSGSWGTQAWLIHKTDAHRTNGSLVPDSSDAKRVLQTLGSKPKHVKGDIFQAKDRPNVPERSKPTHAQRKARMENIRKAHAAHQ